jgi:hypothetical protein
MMTRRELLALLAAPASPAPLRVAAFRADLTPALGEPLIWVQPATEILDPLWAKGVVLEGANGRIVLCAVDWCGIGGSTHRLFREALAGGAGTEAARVAVQSVHQHTAPYVDGDARDVLGKLPNPPLIFSRKSLEGFASRLAAAARAAVSRLEPFDAVGLGSAEVRSVASARRILRQDGTVLTRFSTGGKDPKLAALPEGDIDRTLRTVTLARGTRPIARIHLYSTHPQTFCCDGRVTADFVGTARETLERESGVAEIYLNGCGGDITVGKYNDATDKARSELASRLLRAMRASAESTRFSPAMELNWKTTPVTLPAVKNKPPQDPSRDAITNAFINRKAPLEISSLGVGGVQFLFLPGEPMLEFSRYARRAGGSREILVAGYGDISPGYLCTDEAIRQGGYEPSASNVGPGTEAALKNAIRKLIAP